MRFALVADLHDNLVNFDRFLLAIAGTMYDGLILAGDIGSPETYTYIARQVTCPIWAVAGNLESDIGSRQYVDLNHDFPHLHYSPVEPFVFSIGQTTIELRHHPVKALQPKEQPAPNLVVFGHTHRPELTRSGLTWNVNPGTLSGWPNPATYTVCTEDTGRLHLTLHRLEIKNK